MLETWLSIGRVAPQCLDPTRQCSMRGNSDLPVSDFRVSVLFWICKSCFIATIPQNRVDTATHHQSSQTMSWLTSCLGRGADDGTDLTEIFSAGTQASKLAEELMQLSSNTQTRSLNVVGFAGEIRETFAGLNIKMNASTFKAIIDVLNGDKMKDMIALASEMDDLALECVNKSIAMKETVTRGTSSLPRSFKDEPSGDDTYVDEGEQELADLGRDIADLEECTSSLRTMNIFSAATKGTRAFDGLLSKKSVIETTFQRIKELCAIVARASQNMISETCCGQIQAGIYAIRAMFQSLRLSKLIEKLTEAGKRLLDAIKNLILVAWEKFQHFTEEFVAAKKIKNFVNGINPMNSKAGDVIKQGAAFVDSITNGNNGFGKNLICGVLSR
jgi:hypothetical protein